MVWKNKYRLLWSTVRYNLILDSFFSYLMKWYTVFLGVNFLQMKISAFTVKLMVASDYIMNINGVFKYLKYALKLIVS